MGSQKPLNTWRGGLCWQGATTRKITDIIAMAVAGLEFAEGGASHLKTSSRTWAQGRPLITVLIE